MSTLKQIEANRRNAQKSTGPRTSQGKAASKMNALKTGIDAESLFIHMEEPADLEALIAEYYRRFQPATPEERCFVDILIRDEWQLRRLGAIEAELWEHQLSLIHDDEPYPRGHAFQLAESAFARLQRRIDQTERSYKSALHELQRLQQSRPAQPVDNQPELPQIGFVPQMVGSAFPPAPGFQSACPSEPVLPLLESAHQRANPSRLALTPPFLNRYK